MSLNIGSNQISPIQIDNVINNQLNKTVTPTKSQQVITVNDTIFEMPSYFRDGSSTEYKNFNGSGLTSSDTILITGWVGYERSGAVTQHWRNINIQTLYTTQTFNYDSSHYIKLDTSRQRLEIHTGEITCYQLNMYKLSGYDGMDQVTIEPIPSDYIIPEGTLTISAPGIVNATSYASISIPGMTTPTWNTATITNNTGKINYSINLPSGFKSTSQTFTSSITLPSTEGTTIIPSEISQIAVNNYQWTKGSVIVDAIPNSIGIYQKIIKKTVTVDELNVFFSTQTSIPYYAFYSNKSLSGILNLGTVSTIGSSAFTYCTKITDLIGPNVVEISAYALSGVSLNTISLPKVKKISNGFNQNGKVLSSVYFPELISANFSYCNAVSFYDLPKISYLSSYFFYQNYALISINLPSVSFISGGSAFCLCGKLTNIYLPNLTLLSNATAFISGCGNLTTISFPKLTNITGGNVFNSCAKLTSLYLMNNSVIQVSTSSFIGTSSPFLNSSYLSGQYASIYVPSSLVNDYKTHSIWSWFTDRFVGI